MIQAEMEMMEILQTDQHGQTGKIGEALSFDGTDDFVEYGDLVVLMT